MYLLPQEIEVWYIIPTIRRELSRLLTKRYKLTFEKTGEILGISKAAVSQYLGNKRAGKIKFTPEIKKEIEKSAKLISENKNLAVKEIMKILKIMKVKGCACGVCKKFNKGILGQCSCTPI